MKKVILITGASSGLGMATACALATEGHRVYGTSRTIMENADLPFRTLKMDVTSTGSVERVIEQILDKEGRIDVLINNAGNGITGPLYRMPVEAAKRQFEVNFFGMVRVCSAVLPGMVNAGEGLVINVGSLAGLFGLPYQGLYSASKFAVEGYSESLRMELLNTGVKVVVVNPGDFKTEFTVNREKLFVNISQPKLEADYQAAVSTMEKDEQRGADPVWVAEKMVKIISLDEPAHRYLIGSLSQTIVPALKRLLPGKVFARLINKHYGIK